MLAKIAKGEPLWGRLRDETDLEWQFFCAWRDSRPRPPVPEEGKYLAVRHNWHERAQIWDAYESLQGMSLAECSQTLLSNLMTAMLFESREALRRALVSPGESKLDPGTVVKLLELISDPERLQTKQAQYDFSELPEDEKWQLLQAIEKAEKK